MMERPEVSLFSGIAGRVVREAMSLGTLLTGVCLGVFLFFLSFGLASLGNEFVATLSAQAVVALALARFALNGMWGEWRGTIFSTAGGSWMRASGVAARYLALSAIWVVPVGLLAGGLREAGQNAISPLEVLGSEQVPALLLLCAAGMALTPPAFLIVSVRAVSFGDLLLPGHWKQSFSGRLGDLYAIYVLYLGSMAILLLLSLPALALGFAAGVGVGLAVSGATLAFAGGMAVTLLGRLCGFYAFEADDEPRLEVAAPPPMRRVAGAGAPAPAAGGHGPAPGSPGLPAGAPEARSSAAGAARAVGRPAAPPAEGGAARQAPAAPAAMGHPGARGAGGRPAPPPGKHAAAPAQAAAVGSYAAVPPQPAAAGGAAQAGGRPAGKPPLMDAGKRVDEARQRFATDREGALRALEGLRASHAPNPQVLHALVVLRHQAGQEEKAVETAREAFPLCFQRGNIALAAEMFRTLWRRFGALALDRDQILAIAGALVKAGDLKHATSAYALVVKMDPAERRAIKGLLQVADLNLHAGGSPDDAAKIYKFLLQNCPDSPFEQDIRSGLAETERRLARVP